MPLRWKSYDRNQFILINFVKVSKRMPTIDNFPGNLLLRQVGLASTQHETFEENLSISILIRICCWHARWHWKSVYKLIDMTFVGCARDRAPSIHWKNKRKEGKRKNVRKDNKKTISSDWLVGERNECRVSYPNSRAIINIYSSEWRRD